MASRARRLPTSPGSLLLGIFTLLAWVVVVPMVHGHPAGVTHAPQDAVPHAEGEHVADGDEHAHDDATAHSDLVVARDQPRSSVDTPTVVLVAAVPVVLLAALVAGRRLAPRGPTAARPPPTPVQQRVVLTV